MGSHEVNFHKMPKINFHSLPRLTLFIGKDRLTGSGHGVTHHYAGTGQPSGDVRLGSADDVDAAVSAARAALPGWRSMDPTARRNIMLRAAALLVDRIDRLAFLSTVDTGLTQATVRAAVMTAAEWLIYYAGWIDKAVGQLVPTDHGALDYVRYEPYGVIGIIVPSNSPVSGMILGPVLAAGNCAVLKPSELTPYTMAEYAQVYLDAGLPTGVLNVVPGDAIAGEALVRHCGIDKIHFTGSGVVGAKVASIAAGLLKPSSLELGGKSANLVFSDANLDLAADLAMRAIVRQSGQSCVAGTRILVHESIADELLEKTISRTQQQKIGNPMAADSIVGPVITAVSCARILSVIDQAVAQGQGQLALGGHRVGGKLSGGYFISPTIFSDVRNDSAIAVEETFGPVISFIRFRNDDEAVALANASKFGLAAYIQTTDLGRAHRTAEQLDVGNVWINGTRGIVPGGPFGGAKQSGFGRLGGLNGLREFSRSKNTWIGL